MRSLILLVRIIELSFMEKIRYPVEFFMGLINSAALITFILVGTRLGGTSLVERVGISFILQVVLVQVVYASLRFLDTRGSDAEEAYFYPVSLEAQLAITGLAELCHAVVLFTLIYGVVAVLLKLPVWGVWMIIRYSFLLFPASMGISYLLTAAHLLFKRMQPLATLCTILLMGTAFYPKHLIQQLSRWLPFAMAVEEIGGGQVNHLVMALLSLLFFLVGFLAFRQAKRLTVQYGLTGLR